MEKIKVGQLRKWKSTTYDAGDVFLIVSLDDEPITPASPVWIGYIQDNEICYDHSEWMLEHSDAIDQS